jgi:hypothetical protein
LNKSNLPYNCHIADIFWNCHEVKLFEGGAIIAAEQEGSYYLIVDERTMADFLGPEDQDLLEKLVTVYEFETEKERQEHLGNYGKMKKD